MSTILSNQYLLVMPSGNVKGFDDYGVAKGYINIYYYLRTRNCDLVSIDDDLTDVFDDIQDTVCYEIGVREGECKLYYTNDVIERLQEELVFDEEKQEVISKLMQPKIEFNIYDYAVDNVFNNVEAIDVMEQYGNAVTGQ